jgi:ribose transport system permease protein
MVAVFSGLAPATFFTTSDFESILNTQTVLVVLALGLTVALAVGEFDMSITAVVDFTAVLVAHLTGVSHWSPGLVVVLSLGVALCIGVTNAIIVVVLGVNSFITTLAMGTLVVGLVVAFFGATTTGNLPTAITQPVSTQVHGLDLSVFYAFGLVIILWYILENTPVGRQIFFTGEGREAARLGGIRVNRIRFGGLVTSAVGAWLAGILLLGQTGAANPTIGDAFLLPAFAAAFLGATTIRPGRFNALGTLTAVYLLAVGAVGLQLLGAADWVTDVFNGGALIIAVTFAQVASRGRPNWTRSRRLSIAEPVERAEAVT